jgi:hypothetical protein
MDKLQDSGSGSVKSCDYESGLLRPGPLLEHIVLRLIFLLSNIICFFIWTNEPGRRRDSNTSSPAMIER